MRSTGTEASWDNLSKCVFWGIFRQARAYTCRHDIMQFHISEASNVRISGFTAAWIHLSIWMFWWSRSICRVMQGGGLRCCLLSPTTATWSMVCPKYGKYFKLVQGGKTFMKKAWVFGADKLFPILCKESWVFTGLNKTQCQLCKRLAGPFIPLSWSKKEFHFGYDH